MALTIQNILLPT